MDLRRSFDRQAQLYDRTRPHYPAELFTKLIEVTNIRPGDRLLEIGPGTGQATEPLAAKGYHITAIELGEHLAATARHKLQGYPTVDIITGSFEKADLAAHSFRLIYSATAFHWIKPEVKYVKTHELLEPGGYLAIIHTNHVAGGPTDRFQQESQHIYNRFWPGQAVPHKLPLVSELTPPDFDPKLFKLTYFGSFPCTIRYNASQYADLLSTYSPTLALPAEARRAFLRDMRQFVDETLGGYYDKVYAMSLAIALAA